MLCDRWVWKLASGSCAGIREMAKIKFKEKFLLYLRLGLRNCLMNTQISCVCKIVDVNIKEFEQIFLNVL